MKAVPFAEATGLLLAPKGMENCSDLHVFSDGEYVISCWMPSWRERIKLMFTGRLWLMFVGARTHPPVALLTEHPFEQSSWERK